MVTITAPIVAVGSLVLLAIVGRFIGPRVARKRILGVRPEISDAQLVELFSEVSLPSATIIEILRDVGACYGIVYAQLRPNDCFITQLSKIDSWSFDAGAEKMETLVREKFGVTVPSGVKTYTILDLLKLVEDGAHRINSKLNSRV